MRLKWEGNQKYNQDISTATIRTIKEPIRMSIHYYIGCNDMLFFSCFFLGIKCQDLDTSDWDIAEMKVIEILKQTLEKIQNQINIIIKDYNN